MSNIQMPIVVSVMVALLLFGILAMLLRGVLR